MSKKPWLYSYTREALIDAVKTSTVYREVLQKLGIVAAGGNYQTLRKRIAAEGLSTAHFVGGHWARGRELAKKPVAYYLENTTAISSHHLKERLLSEGLLPAVCSCCHLEAWQSQPIPLELHHRNGIHTDNHLENLCLLCPNCHALTPNYRGKNQERKPKAKTQPRVAKPSAVRITKIQWPPVSELVSRIAASSCTAVARELGVSDQAVYKRIRNHGGLVQLAETGLLKGP